MCLYTCEKLRVELSRRVCVCVCMVKNARSTAVLACMHMWVKKKRYNLLGRSLDCSIITAAAAEAAALCHKVGSLNYF